MEMHAKCTKISRDKRSRQDFWKLDEPEWDSTVRLHKSKGKVDYEIQNIRKKFIRQILKDGSG